MTTTPEGVGSEESGLLRAVGGHSWDLVFTGDL